MKKHLINILIGLSSGIIILIIIQRTNDPGELLKQIFNLNLTWVGLAFLCMLINWFLEANILHAITKFRYMKHQFVNSVKVTMVGQFFSSITPFASGGQPAQMYVLMKDGIEAGHAGSILMIKFIVFQVVLSVYSFCVILFQANFFRARVDHFFFLAIVGFVVNLVVILLALLFARYENLTKKLLTGVLKLLYSLKVVKNTDRLMDKLTRELARFHGSAALIRDNKQLLLTTTFLTVVQLTFFFAIPYCIYRSFGLVGVSLFTMIAAKAFVTMVTSFIPLPGACGGAEGSFYLFFSLFFPSRTIVLAILLWRGITYYCNLGFGAFVTSLTMRKWWGFMKT